MVSMAVPSDGSYGIEEGLVYSFPVRTKPDHTYEIDLDTAWRNGFPKSHNFLPHCLELPTEQLPTKKSIKDIKTFNLFYL